MHPGDGFKNNEQLEVKSDKLETEKYGLKSELMLEK